MVQKHKLDQFFCEEYPIDCTFEIKSYEVGATVQNEDTDTNYLIFCNSGYVRIVSTLFHDEILYAGEVMFVPRGSECSGVALSDVILFVHKFNNTVCNAEKCILTFLYSHRHYNTKIYCCKLTISEPLQTFINGIIPYIINETHDADLWELKHRELIWVFTRYYDVEELQAFFHPMTSEQIPFQKLVLTHYRKAGNTEELAGLCGYGVHTFRRLFKKEFDVPVYQWLIKKRAENIRYRLSLSFIPLTDIIDEFNFSSAQHFNSFCKQYLGDTPGNLRKAMQVASE